MQRYKSDLDQQNALLTDRLKEVEDLVDVERKAYGSTVVELQSKVNALVSGVLT